MRELVIDISKYDEDIDLAAWKEQRGLWGVIIKVGGNEGGRYKDKLFETHYADAKALGLHIGFYYYTTTTDVANANVDANHMISLVDGKDYDLPWYIDVEDPRQLALSPRALTDIIKSFCNTLVNKGYYAGLYTSGSAWLNNMYSNELMEYANWIAWWRSEWPYEAGDIGLWQQGCMNINGDVVFEDVGNGYRDVDWCVVDYPSRIREGQKKKEESTIPVQNGSDPIENDGFCYRAHVQDAGWLPTVRDGQIAGTTGFGARLEALKFRPTPEMGELDVDVHMQGIGWKEFHGIKAGDASGEFASDIDPICGTIGESRRIEAIKLTLRGNTTGKKLRYMGHVQDVGWTDPVWEGEVCGTVGEAKRLEAVRIWLESDEAPAIIVVDEPIENGKGRATDVINAAYGELGYYAPDDPERGSKYGRWLAELTGEDWLAGPSNEIFWCCMFASWCLDQGGVQMDGFPTQNTDLALNGGAKKYAVPIENVQYGDIVIFNWDWDNTTDHIGFATGEFDGTGFTTIEGNVGNAVKEKYRQLGNVAYVLRPPYEAYGVHGSNMPSVSTDPKNNRDGGKLDVDGIGGWNTIIDWQNQLHVIEDGWIDGQDADNYRYFKGISNVRFDETGSKLVMTIQSIVGATVDGIWGKDTSTKIQEWLVDRGYPCTVDGFFAANSVTALQESLNNGAWKLF